MGHIQILFEDIDTNGRWRILLSISYIISLIFFLKPYIKKIGLSAVLLWGYVLAYCVYLIEYPALSFGVVNTAYQATAGAAFLAALLIPFLCIEKTSLIIKSIPYVAAIEMLAIVTNRRGLLTAQSFDLSFVSLCIPFVNFYLCIPIVLLVLFKHGATAKLILTAQIIVYAFKCKKYRISCCIMLAALAAMALYKSYNPISDGVERFQKWEQMLKIWSTDMPRIIFGTGPGSFIWQSLIADNFEQKSYGVFLQMHSDVLQILFEFGIVGLALSFAVLATAVKRSWNNPRILSAVFGSAAFALAYHPLHFAPSAILIGLIISLSLKLGLDKNK